MFIIIAFLLGSDRPSGLFFCAGFTSFLTHASLFTFFSGEGGWFVIFWIFKSILFFVNWISLYYFHFL